MLFYVVLLVQVGRKDVLVPFAALAVQAVFLTVTNLGLVFGRSYGPIVSMCHSGLIVASSLLNVAVGSPPGSSPGVALGRTVGTLVVLMVHALLLFVAYRALVTHDEHAAPVSTQTTDLHSAAAIVLAMAASADGNPSAAKTRLAAQRLSDLMGTGATVEALERRINFALKSANDAALERACEALAAAYSPEQLTWLQKAAAEIAGSDELACGWLEELAAKFGTT